MAVNITAILGTNSAADGDHLDGAEVTVTFTDGSTDQAIWHQSRKVSGLDEGMATGDIVDVNGDRVGTAWWLALNGSTTTSSIIFFNNTGKGIVNLKVDLRRSAAVWDIDPTELTPGSGTGVAFTVTDAPAGVVAVATYEQPAGLSGAPPAGDWYAIANIAFTNEGGFPSGSGYDPLTTNDIDHFTFRIGFDNVTYDSADVPAAEVVEEWDGLKITSYNSVFGGGGTPSVTADFDGAIACVTFIDDTKEAVLWDGANGAVGTGWDVTGVGFFTFNNTGSLGIKRLMIDLTGTGVCWAASWWGDKGSSNFTLHKTFGIDALVATNSWETIDFGSKPIDLVYTNTMRDAIGFLEQNPTGDLFAISEANFTSPGGFKSGDTIVFVAASRFCTYDSSTIPLIRECYVPGTSYVTHDLRNKFVYRPDGRIYFRPETHSPKDGAPLVSWRQTLRDETIGFDDNLDEDLAEF